MRSELRRKTKAPHIDLFAVSLPAECTGWESSWGKESELVRDRVVMIEIEITKAGERHVKISIAWRWDRKS